MNAEWMQTVLIAAIVTASTLVTLRRVLPGSFQRVQAAIAHALSQPARPALMRRIGRWAQPAEARNGSCGTGAGCGSCGGCGSTPVAGDTIPLVFQPRSHTRLG